MLKNADLIRFWDSIEKHGDTACWPWRGPANTKGYGRFNANGTRYTATRLALALRLGRDLTEDEQACHSCDNPPCCNPAHLFVGTQTQNIADRQAKNRTHRWNGARAGSRNQRAVLSEAMVADIRQLKGSALQREIAAKYGVSRQTISAILNGNRWGSTSGAVGEAETPKHPLNTTDHQSNE